MGIAIQSFNITSDACLKTWREAIKERNEASAAWKELQNKTGAERIAAHLRFLDSEDIVERAKSLYFASRRDSICNGVREILGGENDETRKAMRRIEAILREAKATL